MRYGLVVGSRRLLAAADVLLEAMDEGGGDRVRILSYAGDPRPEAPPPTRRFTGLELREAMGLLVSIGLVSEPAMVAA